MTEKESLGKRMDRWNETAERWMNRHLRKGAGYRILTGITTGLLLGIGAGVGLAIILLAQVFHFELDTSTIASIIVADIPVGLVLWFVTSSSESKESKLINAIEVAEAPARYAHLEVHYCDEWADGVYPELFYYIVNTKSKRAYWIDKRIHELVEARIIRQSPKHRDREDLLRYLEAHQIRQAGGYPQGDDLFTATPRDDI